MHLRSIKLRGFKSFPDPVEVVLEPGVAVVVGPNGSGKSNVADAIVWAAGSLTPSELRAEKPDDVLFGGSANRSAADHCEVELVFDNEDGGFGDELDYSEISIVRRLVRGGEGQYLVNRAPVRRTDLVELLADVGLGGSMHSIVGQGKVDAVLASKPADRRALVEEAAGLGKFKRRRHRAELKLARVAAQVERAKDVEDEVRKRLRPLALQATAAERAEKLVVEIAGLRARVARLDLAGIEARRAEADERRPGGGARAQVGAGAPRERAGGIANRSRLELSDAAGAPGVRSRGALPAPGRGRAACGARRVGGDRGGPVRGRPRRGACRPARHGRDEAVRRLWRRSPRGRRSRARRRRRAWSGSRARTARARAARGVRARQRRAGRAAARDDPRRARSARRRACGARQGRTAPRIGRSSALGAARERLRGRREVGVRARRPAGRAPRGRSRARADAARPDPAELERRADAARLEARAATGERDDLAERARTARERLAALERSLAEREGIAPAARALAEEGERLALASLEVEPGHEKAVAAALAWRASALLAGDRATPST